MAITFGSLFAGIGGADLGLERAGMTCVWQVEIDSYCRRVLAKHWPDVRRHDDVRTFPPDGRPDDWRVDLVVGGFPCQDISAAGKRFGIAGTRSGLWSEFARCVGLLRPRFVVVENVGALAGRGLGRVLGDLSALGFDAEWSVVSACAMGAPHTRERMFVVAHADGEQSGQRWGQRLADASQGQRHLCLWPGQPEPLRVADGLSARLDRNHALGNAMMPQIAEWIGRTLLAAIADPDLEGLTCP